MGSSTKRVGFGHPSYILKNFEEKIDAVIITNVGGRTPRARKPKKKEMRRAEKESLDREKTLNSERVRKQCVGKR